MLKPYFSKLVIRDKLLVMQLAVLAVAMLIVFIISVAYQYLSYQRELMQDLNAQMTLIEDNVGSAIAFEDSKAAAETLQSLSINRSIDQAYIVLKNQTQFAGYYAGNHQYHNDKAVKAITQRKSGIHLNRPIMVNGQQLATLYVDANFDKVNARIQVFAFALFFAVTFATFFARVMSKRLNHVLTEPILYLESLVTNITKFHNYKQRSNIHSADEIGALSEGINSMLDNIKMRDDKLVEELKHRIVVEKKLDQLAYVDSQTKLPNRHAFTEYLNKCTGEHQACFYLLMLDLDFFKVVNDTHGHEAGDQLLTQCGQRLRRILNGDDTVFRIGGDEFAIVIKAVNVIYDVEKICHRIIHSISQKFMIDGQEVHIGTSIGIAQFTNGCSESNLIKYADVAMYWAKSAGKNTFKFYSEEVEQANYHHQKLTTDLQTALKLNQFELYYQPIVNVQTSAIEGFEALLRWHHPKEGMISPFVFIPIAENTGAITTIGAWVIQQAIAQIKVWQEQFDQHLFMNINISARQFFDKRVVDIVRKALSDSDVNPNTIHIELTESVLMEDVEKAVGILKQLRALGAGISIDDFGTGHSSMSYLKQFPVDTIKIDKSFVRGLPTDSVDTAIVEAIFALAKSLRFDVVAEGVESKQQLDCLKLNKCTKVQGYLFSEPVPAQTIETYLAHSSKLSYQ
jgi:diguanylate cyclase (GGDEF)-like protein